MQAVAPESHTILSWHSIEWFPSMGGETSPNSSMCLVRMMLAWTLEFCGKKEFCCDPEIRPALLTYHGRSRAGREIRFPDRSKYCPQLMREFGARFLGPLFERRQWGAEKGSGISFRPWLSWLGSCCPGVRFTRRLKWWRRFRSRCFRSSLSWPIVALGRVAWPPFLQER